LIERGGKVDKRKRMIRSKEKEEGRHRDGWAIAPGVFVSGPNCR
jgi:hypothetical protein